MALLDRLFGSKEIVGVWILAGETPGGLQAGLLAQGTKVVKTMDAQSMIARTDADLGLGGSLVRFVGDSIPSIEHVGEKSDAEWVSFIESRFRGRDLKCSRWVSKLDAEYVVVVVFGR